MDASAIVKWFVSEKDTNKALKLRELYIKRGLEQLSPTLAYYEVANALRYNPYYRLTDIELFNVVEALKNMQITIEPTDEAWLNAFKISLSEKVAVYDAIYT